MTFKKNKSQFNDFASLRGNDKYYICAFLSQGSKPLKSGILKVYYTDKQKDYYNNDYLFQETRLKILFMWKIASTKQTCT